MALLAAPALAADLTCAYRSGGCNAGETELLGLSGNSDAHAELPPVGAGATTGAYTPAICCSGATLTLSAPTPPATGSAACAAGSVPVLWLSSQTDAHAEQAGGANTYRYPVCIDTSPYWSFSLSYPTATPSSPAACAGSLSANTDAHAGDCTAYPLAGAGAKLSLTAREDTTPPSGGSVGYANGYTTETAAVITLNEGSDLETQIVGRQLYSKTATLSNGDCQSYGGWAAVGVQNPGDTDATVTLQNAKCSQFKYTVRNGANLAADYTSGNVLKVDTTDPSPGSISWPAGYTPSSSIALTPTPSSDPESGIQSVKLLQKKADLGNDQCGSFSAWAGAAASPTSGTWTVPLSTNTCYKFAVTATNNAGATAPDLLQTPDPADSAALKADATAPVTTDSADTSPHGMSYSVELKCTDAGAGCAQYQVCNYKQDETPCDPANEQAQSYSTPTAQAAGDRTATYPLSCSSSESPCKRFVRYRSIDAAGNAEAARSTVLITQDATLATCTLASLPRYSTSSSLAVSGTTAAPAGTTIASAIVTATNSTDAVTKTFSVSSNSFSGSFANLKDGSDYAFKCVPVDSTSKQGSHVNTQTVTVDATQPTAAIRIIPAYPGQSQWVNSSFAVEWSGSDTGSGVERYTAESASQLASSSAAPTFTQLAVTTNPDSGSSAQAVTHGTTYTYRVTAKDLAGNTKLSSTVSTTADLSPPTCTLPALPAVTGSPGSLTITPAAADPLSGLASVSIEHTTNNATWQAATLDSGSVTLPFSDGAQPVLRCIAVDNAGNSMNSSNVSTQIDIGGPTFNATYPGQAALGDTVTLRVEATDPFGISAFSLANSTATLATLATPAGRNATLLYTFVVSLPYGARSFTTTATDSNGNTRTQSLTLTVSECVLGTSRACGSNIGQCRSGSQSCDSTTQGPRWGACGGTGSVAPSTEVCDAKDNDCDGTIDESLTRTGTSKVVVSGACTTATEVCANGTWAPQGTPPAAFDTCGDNKDNNCDGQVDESCVCSPLGQERSCGTTSVGACEFGTQACSAAGWGQCLGSVEPVAESCDTIVDDDCDGQVNEGCAAQALCPNGPIPSSGCSCGGALYSYGFCLNGVFSVEPPPGYQPTPPGPPTAPPLPEILSSPWMYLSIAGVLILIILVILIARLRSKGKDLSWEELQKQWG